MWNERTRTLYLQVGTGEANNYYFGDHDIWRLPQADDRYHGADPRYQYIRHPPVFRAGPPGAPISPNLAGRLAADFALCYRVFRTSDPRYAEPVPALGRDRLRDGGNALEGPACGPCCPWTSTARRPGATT